MINRNLGFQSWMTINMKTKVDILSGANMAFRRHILLDVNGFDENFYGPSSGEDADLCLRIIQKGHNLVYDPTAVSYHYSNYLKRSKEKDASYFFALADNQSYWVLKNAKVPIWKWVIVIIYRLSNALFWMIYTKRLTTFTNYVKGAINGYFNAKSIQHNRILKG